MAEEGNMSFVEVVQNESQSLNRKEISISAGQFARQIYMVYFGTIHLLYIHLKIVESSFFCKILNRVWILSNCFRP